MWITRLAEGLRLRITCSGCGHELRLAIRHGEQPELALDDVDRHFDFQKEPGDKLSRRERRADTTA